MKKKLVYIGFVVILCSLLGFMMARYNTVSKKWETAMANVKAYDKELSSEKSTNVALQLTIDQLRNYSDSVLQELNKTRKALKIKDSQVQSVQYIPSYFTKTDTLCLVDTIFRNPKVEIDTVLGNKWYNISLYLKYPSTIIVKPSLVSEKHIVVYKKKETVNPPKKFFLFRWFQKKHTVLNVEVVEKNPYIQNGKSKYVEVIK